MAPYGEESLLVGMSEHAPEAMGEIRGEVRVSESHVERVAVVRHRYELGCGRLAAAATVEETQIRVVVDIVAEHSLRRPVVLDTVVFLPVGEVVGNGRLEVQTQLGAQLLRLILEREAGTVTLTVVGYIVRIYRVQRLAGSDVLEAAIAQFIDVSRIFHGAVVAVLVLGIVAPGILVAHFEKELVCQRLGIYGTGPYRGGLGTAVIALVHEAALPPVIEKHVGHRLVETGNLVVAVTVTHIHGKGPACLFAYLLTEEQEAAGLPAVVGAICTGETPVGGIPLLTVTGQGCSLGILVEATASEIELRLEENGSLVRELVLKPDSETVALGEGVGPAVTVGNEVPSVVLVGNLARRLFYLLLAAIVEIVASQIHSAVQQGPDSVESAHPGSEYAAVVSPHSAATAHSAAAASHCGHHGPGHIVEAPVVGVVSIQYQADLPLVCEIPHHSCALPACRLAEAYGLDVVSATAHNIAEPAVHHSPLYAEVDDGLLLAVVNAGEHCLVGFLLDHLHLLDYLGRYVFGRERRVVQEEGLAVNGYLLDFLTISRHLTVGIHFDARKLLEQLFEHIVVSCPER